jgi:hypothetical protein
MEKELDIVKLMQVIREVQNFLRNFMTQEQKLLLKLGAINVIDVETSDSNYK